MRKTANLLKRAWPRTFCAVLALFASILPGKCAQQYDLSEPRVFFTNVASRLLRSQLNLDLNRIQLYPTNQYNSAVQQLLQLTANVYDAATNHVPGDYPFLPTVFRPTFTNDNGTIFINGYVEETGLNILSVPMRDLNNAGDRAALQANDMIYGIPIVIGAKKGYPNFNEFGFLNDIRVSRDLTFHRSMPQGPIVSTNQIYNLSISKTYCC